MVDLRYVFCNVEKMVVRLVGKYGLLVRKVKWDLYNGIRLLSVGYDMICRVYVYLFYFDIFC